jgi:hypothetical protein
MYTEHTDTAAPDLDDRQVKALLIDHWLGERITLEGIVDHSELKGSRYVTLVQNLTLTLPTREQYYLSHTWLQKSDTLKDLARGTRFHCTARVRSYVNTKLNETSAGFTLPDQPQVMEAAPALRAMQTTQEQTIATAVGAPRTPTPEARNPMQILLHLKSSVEALGGTEQVLTILAAIESAGGLDKVLAVHKLAEAMEGADNLKAVLGMLK